MKFNHAMLTVVPLTVLLIGQWGCGNPNAATKAGQKPNIAPSQSADSEAEKEKAAKHEPLKLTEIEPTLAGGAWARGIQLDDPKPGYWTVEKLVKGVWLGVGYTDAQGYYRDNDVSEPTQYRVGSTYSTPMLGGLRDLILSGEYSDDQPFEATRVFILKDTLVRVGSHPAQFIARKVQIDGTLVAYPRAIRGTPQHVSSLSVRAEELSGTGVIDFRGIRGIDGEPGRDGANGHAGTDEAHPNGDDGQNGSPGSSGLEGGAGGKIILMVNKLNFDLSNIVVTGGPGGDGGAGGVGGAGGAPATWIEYRRTGSAKADNPTDHYLKIAHSGKPGSNGKSGERGAAGKSGESGNILKIDLNN